MPIPKKYIANFEEGCIYHVYNRTNNKEPLFLTDENRLYFLKRFKEVLSPFIDTYCWCLLPNHFHVLIKVKSEKTILSHLQGKTKSELTISENIFLETVTKGYQPFEGWQPSNNHKTINLSELIEQTFKRFFQSYAMAFNKQHKRNGNLFYKPFKRVKVDRDTQFTMALIYIHSNALKHGLVQNFTTYQWSSWQSIISPHPTLLLRDEVIEWFGSLETFIKVHKELTEYYYNCDVSIEEID